ncbi:MAG: hypothetical protein WCO98_10595 [bacterium]
MTGLFCEAKHILSILSIDVKIRDYSQAITKPCDTSMGQTAFAASPLGVSP